MGTFHRRHKTYATKGATIVAWMANWISDFLALTDAEHLRIMRRSFHRKEYCDHRDQYRTDD
jgi:hypothetical protein